MKFKKYAARNSASLSSLFNLTEKLIALFSLVFLSPILLIGFLLAKSDGGPAFFLQERVGKDARIFRVIKFRSMIVDAEKLLDEQGRFTGNRITFFGHFLRKSSIDELPQLFNVLIGDMSLIGPRPILPRMLPYLTSRERERLIVRPGLTGLAQIKGRNNLRWSRRFNYDLIYIRRKSFCLDLFILWSTFGVVLKAKGLMIDTNPDIVDDVTSRPNVNWSVYNE